MYVYIYIFRAPDFSFNLLEGVDLARARGGLPKQVA